MKIVANMRKLSLLVKYACVVLVVISSTFVLRTTTKTDEFAVSLFSLLLILIMGFNIEFEIRIQYYQVHASNYMAGKYREC